MAQKTQKTKIVAFKVEEELAEFLGKLKNKSEFIRKAILAQFSMGMPALFGFRRRATRIAQSLQAGHFEREQAPVQQVRCTDCIAAQHRRFLGKRTASTRTVLPRRAAVLRQVLRGRSLVRRLRMAHSTRRNCRPLQEGSRPLTIDLPN